MPKLQRLLVAGGLYTGVETAVIGISDHGEEANITRVVADTFLASLERKGIFLCLIG